MNAASIPNGRTAGNRGHVVDWSICRLSVDLRLAGNKPAQRWVGSPGRCWYGSEPLVLSWMRFDMIFTLATGLLGLGSFLLPTGAESGLAGEYRSTVRKLDLAAHTEVEH